MKTINIGAAVVIVLALACSVIATYCIGLDGLAERDAERAKTHSNGYANWPFPAQRP